MAEVEPADTSEDIIRNLDDAGDVCPDGYVEADDVVDKLDADVNRDITPAPTCPPMAVFSLPSPNKIISPVWLDPQGRRLGVLGGRKGPMESRKLWRETLLPHGIMIDPQPKELHFKDFKVGESYSKEFYLVNRGSYSTRVTIMKPKSTKAFKVEYFKKDIFLAPGMQQSVTVHFCPPSYDFFQDAVTVACGGALRQIEFISPLPEMQRKTLSLEVPLYAYWTPSEEKEDENSGP